MDTESTLSSGTEQLGVSAGTLELSSLQALRTPSVMRTWGRPGPWDPVTASPAVPGSRARKGPGATGAAAAAHFRSKPGSERAPAAVSPARPLGAPSWTSVSCVCSVRAADGNHAPDPAGGSSHLGAVPRASKR